MAKHRTYIDLPPVVFDLAPELVRARLPEESRTTCESCVMIGEDHGDGPWPPWAYRSETRCCTYWPPLPGFLVGQALRRGGEGADLVRARVAEPEGRSPWGLRPTAAYLRRASPERFGTDLAQRCPYLSTRHAGCGIWPERGANCRTHYCRLDEGVVGEVRWAALTEALEAAWDALARWCLATGEAPADDAGPAAWEDWFRGCADRAYRATLHDVSPFMDRGLEAGRRRLAEVMHLEAPAVPERVTPIFKSVARPDGRHWVYGRARADGLALAPDAVARLETLAGSRPWREALGDDPASAELIAELVRVGAVADASAVVVRAPPPDARPVPEVVVPAIRRVEPVGGRMVLHSSASPDPVVAPAGVFAFIARLDGATPWRDALAAAQAEGVAELHDALVATLWAHGLLEPT